MPTRTTREAWLQAGLEALSAGGPNAVRVEALARALGVTKGGFYWHFESRRALLDEILCLWERRMLDEVIDRVEAGGGSERSRLRRLFELAGRGNQVLSRFIEVELAIRDWSRRDPAVLARLRRVDNRRMGYMRSLFAAICADPDEVEARCLLAFALFIGGPLLAADHEGVRRAEVRARAVADLLR